MFPPPIVFRLKFTKAEDEMTPGTEKHEASTARATKNRLWRRLLSTDRAEMIRNEQLWAKHGKTLAVTVTGKRTAWTSMEWQTQALENLMGMCGNVWEC